LPPMNNNDAHAPVVAPLFAGAGDQPAFKADYRNRDNGMIYQANPPNAPGAKQSARLNFSLADAADNNVLNAILWRAAKGDVPRPAPKHTVFPGGCGAESRCGRQMRKICIRLTCAVEECANLKLSF